MLPVCCTVQPIDGARQIFVPDGIASRGTISLRRKGRAVVARMFQEYDVSLERQRTRAVLGHNNRAPRAASYVFVPCRIVFKSPPLVRR